MFGFVARLVGGAISPLVDQVSGAASRFARKIALLLGAALCMIVVVIALTIAFFLWIASLVSPVVGALAVAGLYLVMALVLAVVALRGGGSRKARDTSDPETAEAKAREAKLDAEVDQFAGPLMALLAQFGLKRELLAVMAGSSLAKRLGPVPLVGLAIVGGFLIGRMWKGWRAIPDIVAGLASSGLFGLGLGDDEDSGRTKDTDSAKNKESAKDAKRPRNPDPEMDEAA